MWYGVGDGRMVLMTMVREMAKLAMIMKGKTIILSKVTDVACPTDIVFYRHFQLNGSWTEVDVDGRLHVKMIQSSNDLPPPENDQVK